MLLREVIFGQTPLALIFWKKAECTFFLPNFTPASGLEMLLVDVVAEEIVQVPFAT